MSKDANLEVIGLRISKRRREIGMTQEQLAEKMDVSIQMVSNLERGNKAIRIDNLVRLSELLGVSTDFILTGKESNSCIAEEFEKLSERDKGIIINAIRYCREN